MSPDNSLLVACGDAVVVMTVRNATAAGDVAAVIGVVVTLSGKEPSWWDRQTTQGPHSTMGRLVCCQP